MHRTCRTVCAAATRRLAAETEAIEAEKKKKDLAGLKKMSKEDKVERLEQLLAKSVAYSAFLADKIKKVGGRTHAAAAKAKAEA